jgi:alpha-L-rhamnosidase
MELNETAYNLLLQRANPSWLYSVDQGATTTWERWNSYTKESGFGDAGMNSFNHYSYGAVMEWMYRYMAGINPDEKKAGFKHIILTPTPDLRQTTQDRITKTDATYDSYYGKIKSAWEIDDQSKIKYYQVTVPANTTATLTLTLNNDNDKVYENGVIVNDAEGVIRVSPVENKKIVLDLLSGSYFFEIKNPSSINDPLKPSASIHVYPNPAVDNLIVEGLLNNTSVSLNNMHGQKLLQIHPESGKINLSLATFPSGIYILQIVNEQGENSSKKIIVR